MYFLENVFRKSSEEKNMHLSKDWKTRVYLGMLFKFDWQATCTKLVHVQDMVCASQSLCITKNL